MLPVYKFLHSTEELGHRCCCKVDTFKKTAFIFAGKANPHCGIWQRRLTVHRHKTKSLKIVKYTHANVNAENGTEASCF